ncbi:MAG: hypothetical protein RBS68_11870 [Anaerolineales bacterium]|jgi:hypothetical protein|nr:hypothetical protein [Anaerolineales bacterium]
MKDKIIESIGRCNPDEPLNPGDPRWCDFDPARGTNLHDRLSRRLRGAEAEHKYSHIALAGHRGCGKSTELARFMEQARNEGYLPLYAVVNEQADPNEIGFGDLFLLMLRLLDEAFDADSQLKSLPDKTVKVVTDWFHDVTHIEEREVQRVISFSGEAGLGVSTPLGKLLSGLSLLRKTTGSQREQIKQAVEKYPDQLRDNLNLLLADARRLSEKVYPRGMVFILDNLDRYPPEMISKAVLTNSDLLTDIEAHTIFVLPISLLYNPPGETVEDRYEPETLPMLPVYPRGNPQNIHKPSVDALLQAIYRRVDRALFAHPALATRIAQLSGGCPRDLLRLLKESLLESDQCIDERAVTRAASLVRGEMARKLTLRHYDLLAHTHLETTINPDDDGRFLLYRRAALEYDADRWIGVHPLLWDSSEFRASVDAIRSERGVILRA